MKSKTLVSCLEPQCKHVEAEYVSVVNRELFKIELELMDHKTSSHVMIVTKAFDLKC